MPVPLVAGLKIGELGKKGLWCAVAPLIGEDVAEEASEKAKGKKRAAPTANGHTTRSRKKAPS